MNTIIGIHALIEILKVCPKRIAKVLVSSSSKIEKRKKVLIQELTKRKILVQFVSSQKLSHITNQASHQGFVAFLHPKKALNLESLLKKSSHKNNFKILMLDGIYDPQNFGAILRSSECFGVSSVIYSKTHAAPVTPIVSKTSSGASELVDLVSVSNLSYALSQLKQNGFSLIAAHVDEKAKSLQEVCFPDKCVLILGSEGKGIKSSILKKCDFCVFIPMKGKIASLNVAQAAAVILSKFI